jgi:hypothetical protein
MQPSRFLIFMLGIILMTSCKTTGPSAGSPGATTSETSREFDDGEWSKPDVVPHSSARFEVAELGLADDEGIEIRLNEWSGAVGFVTVTNHRKSPVWYLGRRTAGPLLFMLAADGDKWRRFVEASICSTGCHWLRLGPGSSVGGTTTPFWAPGQARIGACFDTREWIADDDVNEHPVGKSNRRELWGPAVLVQ